MEIRFAEYNDLESIVGIYNQAIRAGNATADLFEIALKDKEIWFANHNKSQYPIYILLKDSKIIGWGSISPYRIGRAALKTVAEITYYIDYKYHRIGSGSYLIDYILKDCKRLKIKNLMAFLLEVNSASIGLLKKFGFKQWGYLPNIVELKQENCAHLIYGMKL